MNTELLTNTRVGIEKKFKTKKAITQAGKTIETGMSLFGTDMNRATHYNTLEELEVARTRVHDQVFTELGRSVYGCLMCIPGVTDHSKMVSVNKLLSNPWNEQTDLLTMEDERNIIDCIVDTLPPNRMIKLFVSLADAKINNKRTVKTVLPFLLNSPNIEWWSVKYRKKLRKALVHCWGLKMSSVISSILNKPLLTNKEKRILTINIDKYLVVEDKFHVYQCVKFILSSKEAGYSVKLFKSFYAARVVFSKAKGLPKEIIEGIRATYHPNIDKAETLNVAESSMTVKEKKLVQNQAKKAGVKVEWNPYSQSMIDLMIYGFKMGFTKDIEKALGSKAKAAASLLPFSYDHVGIICDDSFSMTGSDEQRYKALAITYATVEMLKRVSTKTQASIETTSGRSYNIALPPIDGTDIASPLLRLLKKKPDAIFVISDGYENAPEGRFEELLKIAREKLGINVPVYHFNPVSAAESKVALKRLSNDIPLTPVNNPEKMGLSLFKAMLEVDPRGGILELFNMILPQIEKSKELYARKAKPAIEKKVKEVA